MKELNSKAKPISRNEIQEIVRKFRRSLDMEYTNRFPIVEFFENVLPIIIEDFQYEYVPIDEMKEKEGLTMPDKKTILIREDIYRKAVNNDGRSRLTFAHEIWHLIAHGSENISFCKLEEGKHLKKYENPEWQADVFGAELLAPSYLIAELSEQEISDKFCVSNKCAQTQKYYALKGGGLHARF